jgi:hypothetical protein
MQQLFVVLSCLISLFGLSIHDFLVLFVDSTSTNQSRAVQLATRGSFIEFNKFLSIKNGDVDANSQTLPNELYKTC